LGGVAKSQLTNLLASLFRHSLVPPAEKQKTCFEKENQSDFWGYGLNSFVFIYTLYKVVNKNLELQKV
jgi:hypothetical protein